MYATDTFMGHDIHVEATRNARGGWVAQIRFCFDGAPIDLWVPELVTPDWLTRDEALRGGIDQGRLILKTHDR
ncbi:DUF6566 family protein [Burkholderia ambifaria]|jgi:hypothetical protein|uniref:DUF6566 domain-containing protein n=1 Tax=Burkholderia ambifaria IOP40-10 TaxID=396596 RepID=B1F906_9BURK|nr:DUF6566 family protein [Burkholderia ambifaria]EDT05928.1 conserved hypothetical protein [Burkholderia ambifaria IOP40-10]